MVSIVMGDVFSERPFPFSEEISDIIEVLDTGIVISAAAVWNISYRIQVQYLIIQGFPVSFTIECSAVVG